LLRCGEALRQAAGRGACSTTKLLKIPSLGYVCRPTLAEGKKKVQPWGPPTQSHRNFQVIENRLVTRAQGLTKAKKSFRINTAQSQRQSQEVV